MPTQSTRIILMVEPVDFTFNTETAADNEFQKQTSLTPAEVKKQVMAEFEGAVQTLRSKGIQVLCLEKNASLPAMPDAVFPNNWFSTDAAGNVYVYPMAAPNRRAETQQLPDVLQLLKSNGLQVHQIHDLSYKCQENKFLEGTGSMVFDRVHGIVYAALSVRTDLSLAQEYATLAGYNKLIAFHTQSSTGMPFYHTNVVMSVGTGFAVVCLECVTDPAERTLLEQELAKHGTIIPISRQQAEQAFCANGLEVIGADNKRYFVLSSTAYHGFSEEQRMQISRYAELLPVNIPTIEHIGGGSARCMMAEIFLPVM